MTPDISVDCQVERGEVVVVPQLDGEASVYLQCKATDVPYSVVCSDDNDVCRAYQELETVDVVVHDSTVHSAGQRTLVLIQSTTAGGLNQL